MVATTVAAALIGLLVLSTVRMRRREKRRDSVRRFSDARQAMSAIHRMSAVRRSSATAAPSGAEPSEPSSVVVRDGSATLFDPIARRRVDEVRKSFRGDSEMLARRPTVAMLPRLLAAPHPEAGTRTNGTSPTGEQDADTPAAPLPFRTSEAS